MQRNDTYPNYPQNPQQMSPYQPNNNYPPYQAPQLVANNYPQYQPIPPQASLPNNYQIPQNVYIQQPQPLPQPNIVGTNYVTGVGGAPQQQQQQLPQLAPQPQQIYPQNIYPQNMVGSVQNIPNINLAPAYSTPSRTGELVFCLFQSNQFLHNLTLCNIIAYSASYYNYINDAKSTSIFKICMWS